MGASAPLDSPTSIMSSARSGITPLEASAACSDSPSRTICVVCVTVLRTNLLVMASDAVLRAATSGVPPVNKVASVLENCATWNFSMVSPMIGMRNFKRSNAAPPSSERDHASTAITAIKKAATNARK